MSKHARNVSLAFAAERALEFFVTSEPLTHPYMDMRAQVILSSAFLDFSILKGSTLITLIGLYWQQPCPEYRTFDATFVTPWLYLLYSLVSIYIIFAQTGL